MRTLRKGMSGEDVIMWQYFLIGMGYNIGRADGKFGDKTEWGTKRFQKKVRLRPDGVVGRMTIAKAMLLGYGTMEEEQDEGKKSQFWPARPTDIQPLVGNAAREKIFGKFKYVAAPTDRNPEGIKITDDWPKKNIVMVDLPQLSKATNGKYTRMRFHKLAADQLRWLWEAWEKEGLLDRVLSYSGAYYPRFIRGSRKTLSNHSYGSAFDVNVPQNRLGRVPALVGQKGCVRELVPLANEYGFFWGGHFGYPKKGSKRGGRWDGMHFEVCQILTKRP